MTEESLLGGQTDTESADVETEETGSATETEEQTQTETDGAGETGADDAGEGEKEKETKDTVPETYEKFTFENQGDDAEYDQDLHDTFSTVAKENKLTQAQAQEFVSLFEKAVGKLQEKNVTAFNDSRKATLDALRADKTLGGDKFDNTVKDANMVLRTFDPDNTIAEKLKTQRYVTDADLIPVLARARAAMGDDTLEDTRSGTDAKKELADYDKIGWTYPSDD